MFACQTSQLAFGPVNGGHGTHADALLTSMRQKLEVESQPCVRPAHRCSEPSSWSDAEFMLASMRARHCVDATRTPPLAASASGPDLVVAEAYLIAMRERYTSVMHCSSGAERASSNMAPAETATNRELMARLQQERDELAAERTRLAAEKKAVATQQAALARAQVELRKDRNLIAQEKAARAEAIQRPPEQQGMLNMMEDGAWLVESLGLAPATSRATSSSRTASPSHGKGSTQQPTVRINLDGFWSSVEPHLPQPRKGSGLTLQRHYGLLFGCRDDAGTVTIQAAQLCPEFFKWQTPQREQVEEQDVVSVDTVDRFVQDLDKCIQTFLAETFRPWVSELLQSGGSTTADDSHRSLEPVGWMKCCDGEAFSLTQPELQLPRMMQGHSWASTVVVVDEANSSPNEPVFEVFALAAGGERQPQRLMYDELRRC